MHFLQLFLSSQTFLLITQRVKSATARCMAYSFLGLFHLIEQDHYDTSAKGKKMSLFRIVFQSVFIHDFGTKIYLYKNTGPNLQGLLGSGVQNFLQSKVQRKQKDLVHILPKSQMNGAMLPNDASIIFSAAYTYFHYKTLEYQKKNRYSQTYLYTTAQVLSVIWQKKSISANIAFSSLDGFLDCYYVLQTHDPTLGIGHLLSLLFIASFLDILVFRHPVIYLSVALSTAFFNQFSVLLSEW